jgi:hypothetical protein
MCSICLEDFNKMKHLKVSCQFCDFEACKTCVQTYILSVTQEPHCMNCKHEWNREFIDSFCTKAFRNRDYKLHRENVLLEREKAKMPETQPHVTRRLEWKSLRVSYDWLLKLTERIRNCSAFPERIKAPLLDTLRETINDLIENIRALVYSDVPVTTTAVVSQKCPSGECRGFLLDDHTCGVCRVVFCEKCHEPNGEEHTCDPDTVKTIKLLKRDTKPCPSCNTPIHKIEGCSQMWCTQCHTAFDWRTGHVETGRIHNPHYFEFKKRTREHGDIPCGGRPTYFELLDVGASKDLLDLSVKLLEMDRELMYKYGYTYGDNLQLRIHYMTSDLSDEVFKMHIQRRDKHNSKMRDIQDIYRMYIDTMSDLLRQYMLDRENEESYVEEARGLTGYTNLVIERIRKRYISRVPHNIIL